MQQDTVFIRRKLRNLPSNRAMQKKQKIQIGCAGLAALVFILVVWFITIWMAPVDIVVPPRKYPQGNVYPIYKELALQYLEFSQRDTLYKRGTEIISRHSSTSSKKVFLTPSEQKAITYVLEKYEPFRRRYIPLVKNPCVSVYEYDLNWLFPELSQFREWARIEAFLIQEDLKMGKGEQSLERYKAMLLFSDQIKREGNIILALVGSAIQAIACHPITSNWERLSLQECDRLVKITSEWEQSRSPVWQNLLHEKYFGISVFRDLHSGKLKSGDVWGERQLSSFFVRFMNLRAAAREFDHYMNEIIEESKRPILQAKSIPKPHHILNKVILPVFEDVSSTIARTEAVLRMTGCAAAVRSYKLRHGRYPKTLAEAGVKDLNYDPFTGEEFIYKTNPAKGFLLYSVGKDGKDDGGKRAVRNFDKPGTDISPILYRDPGGLSWEAAPPGPPAWMK
jgi:hypothetical protein